MMSYEITQFNIAVPVTEEQFWKWDKLSEERDLFKEIESVGGER
jgi:hypothetical protein